MTELIDTHCHLSHGKLYAQRAEVLERAGDAGVAALVCAAGDLHESRTAVGVAREFEGVYCTAGIHPHDAKDASVEALRQIEELATKDGNVAVGEIGLDYHYDFSPREDQRRAFAAQLEIARRLAKPIVIHTREAFEDTLAVLHESGADASRVLFHSFTGGVADARRALEIGATISYSGIATFKNTGDIRESVKLTPEDRMLVETDAPYLSPEPVRKIKTNEPAHVRHVAEALAAARGITLEEFAAQTTVNAERFFQITLDTNQC